MANDESGYSYFRLRIPADLKAKIEAAAQESGRSLNGQVLASIQAALGQEDEIESLKNRISELFVMNAEMQRQIDRMENDISTVREVGGMHEGNFGR